MGQYFGLDDPATQDVSTGHGMAAVAPDGHEFPAGHSVFVAGSRQKYPGGHVDSTDEP